MGEIIIFKNKIKNKNRVEKATKKKCSAKKVIVILMTFITTFCTITGITVLTLLEKDWQEIAEQSNNDGLELYNLGKYEEAIALYDKAIDLESKGIKDIEVCYYNRGRAYFKLGNYQKAIGDYTKAIEISPQSKYYSERAVAYEMLGDSANAMLDNIKAITTIVE